VVRALPAVESSSTATTGFQTIKIATVFPYWRSESSGNPLRMVEHLAVIRRNANQTFPVIIGLTPRMIVPSGIMISDLITR